MADEHDFSGIDKFTRGDERQARDLRATIAVIARRTEDPSLRDLCVKVLQGRESVRRVFDHATFWEMANASMDNLEQGLDQLTDEEREGVMDRIGDNDTEDEVIDLLMDGGEMPADEPEPEEPPPPADRGPSRWG